MERKQNRIPFIPRMSRQFKPMKHYYCENDISAKLITRAAFMRLLSQQPYPQGQIFIDFDDGIVYLFPYDPDSVDRFAVAYREFEAEYKQFYREQEAIRAGRLMTIVHLDQFGDSDDEGNGMQSTWLTSEETPESTYLSKEHVVLHSSSFDSLTESDKKILSGFLEAGCNARELARRLGKDPSGVLKLVKRAAARLEKKIEENS